MRPAEWRFRLWEQIRIRLEKAGAGKELETLGNPRFNFFAKGYKDFFDTWQHEPSLLWTQKGFGRRLCEPLTRAKRDKFRTAFPAEYQRSIERADAFLENRFAFLGVKFSLPEPIPWQADPVSLNPYPTGFYRNIDIFTNKNAGDVKHVWEVNRLQFLIEIAKAYYLTGEEKYKEKFDTLIRDWIEKNPYKRGIAWASALEVGVRTAGLVWALEFYRASERPDEKVIGAILKLLFLSGRFLYENLSIYFSPYNHLIGETAGLFMVAYLFPSFSEAGKWEKRAWQVLSNQVGRQFHPDGASVEQASFYHHFTLGFYLQAIAVKKINGEALPADLMQRVEQALNFAKLIAKPDGDMPHMGDIDDARSIYFSKPTSWNFRSYQVMGAAWFKRPDMKYTAHKLQEDAFWILSEADLEKYEQLPSEKPKEKSVFLKESGYVFFRSGFDDMAHYSQMDCGPIAHGVFPDDRPSAAHGHADLLAVEIACFGESHLVDPGFSNYRGDFDWHCYFRSTAAHNTIEINGKSQAKQGGILIWSHAPEYKQLAYLDSAMAHALCAEHFGYKNEPGAPVHRRFMAFVENTFWVILDVVYPQKENSEPLQITEHLHFDPQREVRIEDETILSRGTKSLLKIWLMDNPPDKPDIQHHKGGKKAHEGWVSPTYRAVQAASVIEIQRQTALPYKSLKILVPVLNQAADKVDMSVDVSSWQLKIGYKSYRINFDVKANLSDLRVSSGQSPDVLVFSSEPDREETPLIAVAKKKD